MSEERRGWQSRNRTVSRRKYLGYTSAVSLASVGVAGCLGGGDDGDPTITFGISGGSWGEWVVEYFVEPFEEETGNDVEVSYGDRSAQQSQIQANDDPDLNLVHMDNTEALRLGEQGAILPHEEHLDNFEDVAAANRNEYLAGKVFTPFGIGYNTEQIDKDITSWDDLLDPEFEGVVGLPAWGWMASIWLYWINAVQGGTADDVTPGLEFVEEMVNSQDAVVIDTADHATDALDTEEVLITPNMSARTDQVSQVDAQFVYPEDGAIPSFWNVGLVNVDSDQEIEIAADLVDFTLDPGRQAQFSSDIGYPPTIPAAVDEIDDEAFEETPSLKVTEDDMANMEQVKVDWLQAAENRDAHGEEWRRIVEG